MSITAIAREIDHIAPGSPAESSGAYRHPLAWFARRRSSIARGFALFLGGFALLNLAGGMAAPGFDANIWWIDLGFLPPALGSGFIALAGGALLAYGLLPRPGRLLRIAGLAVMVASLAATLGNAAMFYALLGSGTISGGFPIPFSLLVAAGLLLVTRDLLAPDGSRRSRPLLMAGVILGCMILFPLMQMLCFGYTDYRRPADAVVVLGARAYADGRPSVALADRVRTACEIYHQGLAPRLIFSGGPGDGAVHETEAMRRMAVELGVPERAILTDPHGLNTRATARETSLMLERLGARDVMVVSHFYHLPRVKMTYHRMGWNVYTVPAEESYILAALPVYIIREIAGLWVYYLGGFRNG